MSSKTGLPYISVHLIQSLDSNAASLSCFWVIRMNIIKFINFVGFEARLPSPGNFTFRRILPHLCQFCNLITIKYYLALLYWFIMAINSYAIRPQSRSIRFSSTTFSTFFSTTTGAGGLTGCGLCGCVVGAVWAGFVYGSGAGASSSYYSILIP